MTNAISNILSGFSSYSYGGELVFTFRGKRYQLHSRDSQRSKVYKAERAVFTDNGLRGKADYTKESQLQRRVAHLCNTQTVKKLRQEFGFSYMREVKVRLVHGYGGAKSFGGRIHFTTGSCHDWIILHELAHEIAPAHVHHHWPFAYVYLRLVSAFMGAEAAKKLKRSFKRHGVRFTPKRTRQISEEQREVLRERLAAARAAKHQKRAAACKAGGV